MSVNNHTDLTSSVAPLRLNQVGFTSQSDGRQYAIICPDLMDLFAEQMGLMASSEKIDQTVRSGYTLWLSSCINPAFVTEVNKALNSLDALLKTPDQLDRIDDKTRQLFLARVLQWTDAVSLANGLNDCKDFENGKMQMLQQRLVKAGASRKYLKVINFFNEVSQIAFAKNGPLFKYPSFGEISEVAKTSPNGILKREGGNWLLVPSSANPNQKAVFDELKLIVDSFRDLSDKGIPAMMTEQELLYGIALVGQMMTNYLSQIDDAPSTSLQVFRQLAELHNLMYEALESRSSEKGVSLALNESGKESLLYTYGVLNNVLRDEKFSGFYSEKEASQLLKNAEPFVKPFITFHLNPELIHKKHQWTFVSEKEGVNVFKTPSNELVVIFNGNNAFWERKKFDAFAFIGSRGTAFDLNGMVHSQALENAEKARKALSAIMGARSSEIGTFDSIKFMGYGLDGATAQLLGQEYKRSSEGKDKDVTVIGTGVPPFLDEEASASMGLAMTEMTGFKCLNFAMAGDPNIRNLGITGPLGMRYDNTSFTTIPVPQGVVFASEALAGDHRKAYLAMLENSIFMHRTMRTVFSRTERAYDLIDGVKPTLEEKKQLPSITEVSSDEEDFEFIGS
ncbi:putative uncharacterized protein [Waddlia chondrophila 2032/99]|uniref:Uncharacterized protein n=1 Tax=Waddlia chondrophila 2032/99 TaxID=765953 RepID=F8LDG0_9BACT|nr:putative uncharacterized protein [Waddlia chondrophila 2032/99]